MKLIVAIVRPEKLGDVLEALFRAEVRGLTIARIQGHGGETEQVETYRGMTVRMELSEKVRIEIGVSDHFVEPEYLLGNIKKTHMAELVASEQQRNFGQDKLDKLPKYCRDCSVRFACHGECPRNRFITTPDGEPGLNYLCAGYKMFFTHVDRPMKVMADLLRKGRFADEIMQMGIGQD